MSINFYRHLTAVLFAAAAFTSTDVQAVPAYRGAISYTQPDGTEIIFYRSGDENHNMMHDADGRMLIVDAAGWLRYATDEEIAARPALQADADNRKYLFSGAAFPSTGSPRGLVVLVQFSDLKFSMDNPADFYTRMLNSEGFDDYGATGSAADFFIANSGGVFTPQFDVYGPINLSREMSYYGSNDWWGNDMHPEEVVIEALQKLDSTVDFSIYDTNNDGQIDNVFIFYAGYGEADSPSSNSIWPHSADILDFHLPVYYRFDGKLLNRYAMTNEIDYMRRRPDGIGTFVHEFSHVMGLPDLYATDYSVSFTPGEYSALDYGPYNNEGRTPPHFSAFERYCLGWLQPTMLTAGAQVLAPLHTSNAAFLIPTDRPDEFYMLENRRQSAYDTYLPGHGMLVWHIDFDQSKWDNNIVNNNANHQHVDLIEADDMQTSRTRDGDPFPGASNATEFSFATSPALATWAITSTGYAISGIREENDLIYFDVSVEDDKGDNAVDVIESPSGLIYAHNGSIYNDTQTSARVFDMTGRLCGYTASGAPLAVSPGLYIVSNREGSAKLYVNK